MTSIKTTAMAKENKTMDEIHRGLLKKFHTLCGVLGLTEQEKQAVIASYGVESSRDIDTHALVDICAKLSQQVNDRNGNDIDKLRKRCMAAIGSWLRATGKYQSASVIKGIACRATQHDDFNKIPRERLRNLIATFNNKVKDAEAVEAVLSQPVGNVTGTVTGLPPYMLPHGEA